MNLSDFENYIDDRILGRGWEYYYRYECIKSITKEDENTYAAVVSGTDDLQLRSESWLSGRN